MPEEIWIRLIKGETYFYFKSEDFRNIFHFLGKNYFGEFGGHLRKQAPRMVDITTFFQFRVRFSDYASFHVMLKGTSHFLILPQCLVF